MNNMHQCTKKVKILHTSPTAPSKCSELFCFKERDAMRTYIYPENLRATVKLWFWNIRDFCIICAGIILSALLFAKLYTVVPLSLTACFAFLSLRADDTAIMDYMFNAVRFFLTSQQKFIWNKE